MTNTEHATRKINTNTKVWGSYTAHSTEGEWRFLVTIRGVRCVVCLNSRNGAIMIADNVYLNGTVREVRTAIKRAHREAYDSFALRLLTIADAALLLIESLPAPDRMRLIGR